MNEDFNLEDTVLYNGENRPWLKDRPGKIVAFNLTKTSAKVQFTREAGGVYEEWVGVGSLGRVEQDAPKTAEDVLREELRVLNQEYNKVSARYRQLSVRKGQLENALLALNSTIGYGK